MPEIWPGVRGGASVGGQVLDPAKALATYSHTFLIIGAVGAAVGVLLLLLSPWLSRWAHGVNDAANHPAPGAQPSV